jgi:Domain of unknown function (DUF4349)
MAPAPRNLTALLLSLFAALCLLGCAEAMTASAARPEAMPAMAAPPPPEAPQPSDAYRELSGKRMEEAVASNDARGGSPGPASSATPSEPRTQRAPILIYTASLALAVASVIDGLKEIEAMTREYGGFLARRDDHSITIRVPAQRFDDAVLRIEKLGDVLHRNVAVEDVTAEFTDVQTRLKSARAVRDRLKELLAKSTRVQDSLAIEKELSRIDTEIERMETRLKFLRDRAMFSTITVRLEAKRSDMVGTRVRIPANWLDQMGLGRLLSL